MDDLGLIFSLLERNINVSKKDICDFFMKDQKDVCVPKGPKNWYKILKERKLIYKRLGKKIKRQPEKLLMNQVIPWSIGHEKELLHDVRKIFVYDKNRGHPIFWKSVDKEKPCKNVQKLLSLKYPDTFSSSKPHSSVINYGYFGVPPILDKEEGLNRENNKIVQLKKWKEHTCVQQLKMEFKEDLQIMEAFVPDVENLYITGKAYGKQEKVVPIYPTFKIDKAEDDKCNKDIDDDSQIVNPPILKIGSTIVTESVNAKSFEWYTSLFYNETEIKNKKRITIRNMGSTVVRYNWKEIPPHQNYDLPDVCTRRDPVFFFDHDDGIILPGKKNHILIIFITDVPGVFKEKWKLITTPTIHQAPLLFTFHGMSTAFYRKYTFVTTKTIQDYIEKSVKCAKKFAVLKTVDDPSYKYAGKIQYDQMFTEKERFEYCNPCLHYNNFEVTILKKLYFRITQTKWTYSVRQLYQEILKTRRENKKEMYLRMLYQIIKELRKPSLYQPKISLKYSIVYNLLGQFVDKIDFIFNELEMIYGFKKRPEQPETKLSKKRERINSRDKTKKTTETEKTDLEKSLEQTLFYQAERNLQEIINNKKLINFKKAVKRTEKFPAPNRKRKKFRIILIYFCKKILSHIIDEMAEFLAPTMLLEDDVRDLDKNYQATTGFNFV